MSKTPTGSWTWGVPLGTDGYSASSHASLFSSSLPVLFFEKLNFADSDSSRSLDDGSANLNKIDLANAEKCLLEDVETNAAGNLLPGDEDDLLCCIMDEVEITRLLNELDDEEECDIFGCGEGMEMDSELQHSLNVSVSNMNLPDGGVAYGFTQQLFANSAGRVSVEHPYGEHPSRTLFVRNINSNVHDSELGALFEPYGDIRSLYTACKHRGFVMISYYDIRAACAAMRGLQNKLLRKRRLDIRFSIPKDNPSEKDINQGTLVIFNLDASVSDDELFQIFGAYGEIKETRGTPQKHHHKFVEYYDARGAEAALRALNRSEIGGKRITLEPSRPGGARRLVIPLPSQGVEGGEARNVLHQVGSPLANSSPGNWWHFGSSIESKPLPAFPKSPGLEILNPVNANNLPGLASLLRPYPPGSAKFLPIGKAGRPCHINHLFASKDLMQNSAFLQSDSYPDHKLSTGSRPTPAFVESCSSGLQTLSEREFLWGSLPLYPENASSSGSASSAGRKFFSVVQDFPYGHRQGSVLGTYRHHMVSAASDIHLDRYLGYFSQSPETSFMSSVGFGCIGNNRNYVMKIDTSSPVHSGVTVPGKRTEEGPSRFGKISLPKPCFSGNFPYPGLLLIDREGFLESAGGEQLETNWIQISYSKQYHVDLDEITSGQDRRTTLMIQNIPNKYTSKMLLAEIDETHKDSYDFFSLPIDFKSKCNKGYAFINLVSPSRVISFYQTFNGKRWDKFSSGKLASLAYAWIQGSAALILNSQNLNLMDEDRHCQPIPSQSECQEAGNPNALSSCSDIGILVPVGYYSRDSLESSEGNPDEEPKGTNNDLHIPRNR